MNMKKALLSALVALLCISSAVAESLSGTTWISMDEKSGKPRAEIKFFEQGSELTGKVVVIHYQPGDTGICSKCPGEFKDKPIKDFSFIWGLKKEGKDSWGGGHILDPQTGKIYRAKLMLKGDKLFVRGYIGVSMIGRTQVWERKKNT